MDAGSSFCCYSNQVFEEVDLAVLKEDPERLKTKAEVQKKGGQEGEREREGEMTLMTSQHSCQKELHEVIQLQVMTERPQLEMYLN
ncbi:hypothetical protein INR49_031094 [Caranx melampygus]|nr:hypothetical protein INR49_031094 [Caranx melampygus]